MRWSLMLLLLPGCAGALGEIEQAPPDAAPTFESDDDCDAGPEACVAADAAVCVELLSVTCQPTCQQSAACAAATLLSTYEPSGCAAALQNELTYPHCGASPCETLVEKVCGGDPPRAACVDNPGCDPARALRARSIDANATTEAVREALGACTQALEDEAIFAPCS